MSSEVMSTEAVIAGTRSEAAVRRAGLVGITLVRGRDGSAWFASRSSARMRLGNLSGALAFRASVRRAWPRVRRGRRATPTCGKRGSDRAMNCGVRSGRPNFATVVIDEADGEAAPCAHSFRDTMSSGSGWIVAGEAGIACSPARDWPRPPPTLRCPSTIWRSRTSPRGSAGHQGSVEWTPPIWAMPSVWRSAVPGPVP